MPDGLTHEVPLHAGDPAVQHRVIQFSGKRYSLKLDPLTWQVLEQAAAKSAHRLNKFIHSFAEKIDEKINLSAALRRLAIEHLQQDMASLKSELSLYRQAGHTISAAAIAMACPSPCFVVNGKSGRVIGLNDLACKWLGVARDDIIERGLDQYVQIKTATPLPEILKAFAEGRNEPTQAKLVYLKPGRVVISKANLCPAVRRGSSDFDYFVMVDAL